jgi:heme exporter protein D
VYFDSLHALLGMDGHGAYVWTAYLVTLATISYLLIAPLRRRRRFLASLAATRKRVSAQPSGSSQEDP